MPAMMVIPKSIFKVSAIANGPGCGAIKECVTVPPQKWPLHKEIAHGLMPVKKRPNLVAAAVTRRIFEANSRLFSASSRQRLLLQQAVTGHGRKST